MALFRQRQTRTDEVDIMLGCLRPALRLLLEGVQDIDGRGEPHCVDRAKRIAIMVLHNLQHARAAKSPQRLYAMGDTTFLGV